MFYTTHSYHFFYVELGKMGIEFLKVFWQMQFGFYDGSVLKQIGILPWT